MNKEQNKEVGKKAASTQSVDLLKIKCTIVLKRNKQDKQIDKIISVKSNATSWAGGSRRKVRASELIAKPVLTIKKFPVLAKRTNATPKQLEFIAQTPIKELEKLLNNG